MEKHEYRGYEIATLVAPEDDGRLVASWRITPVTDEAKQQTAIGPWLMGGKDLIEGNQAESVARILDRCRQTVDLEFGKAISMEEKGPVPAA
jgi:hypothetical protein